MIFRRIKKPDPNAEQQLREEIRAGGGLEKGDLPALILSAMLTIMPVVLVVLGLFCLIAMLFVS